MIFAGSRTRQDNVWVNEGAVNPFLFKYEVRGGVVIAVRICIVIAWTRITYACLRSGVSQHECGPPPWLLLLCGRISFSQSLCGKFVKSPALTIMQTAGSCLAGETSVAQKGQRTQPDTGKSRMHIMYASKLADWNQGVWGHITHHKG